MLHQPLGDLGGQREAVRAPAAIRAVSKRMVAIMPAIAGSTSSERVDRVEGRLLVLLQVAVVGEAAAP